MNAVSTHLRPLPAPLPMACRLVFLRQGLSLGLGLTKCLVWLASEPCRAYLHLPSAGVTSEHLPVVFTPASFPWVLRLELRSHACKAKHLSNSSYHGTASGKAAFSAGKLLPDLVKWLTLAAGMKLWCSFPRTQPKKRAQV